MASRRRVLSLLRKAVDAKGGIRQCAYSTGPRLPGEDSTNERTFLRVLRAPRPGVPGTLMMSTQGKSPLPGVPGTAAEAAGLAKPATTPATSAAPPAPAPPSSVSGPTQTPASTAPATAPSTGSVQARPVPPPPPAPSPATGLGVADTGGAPPDPFRNIPDKRRTVKKPSILIPAFGIPLLVAWAAYEWYKWQRHDDEMLNVQASIKKMLESGSKATQQAILNKLPGARSPPSTAPTPPAVDSKPVARSTTPAAPTQPGPGTEQDGGNAAHLSSEETAGRVEAPSAETPQAAAAEQAPDATGVQTAATQAGVAATAATAVTEPQPTVAPHAAKDTAAAEATRHEAVAALPEPSVKAGAAPPPPPTVTTTSTTEAAATAAAAAVASGVEPHEPVLQHADEAEVPYMKKGALGVNLDLSPSGLISFAIERQRGAGKDWMAYPHHLNQAIADAELMGRAAEQMNAWHEAQLADLRKAHSQEVARLQEDAQKHQHRAQAAVEQLQARYETFRRLLRQHQEMALELRDLEVQQAEKRVGLRAHQAMEAERKARLAALDEVRLQLSALATAHTARIQQQITSHISHTLSLGVLALDQALANGLPLKPHLQKLVSHAAAAHATRPEVPVAEEQGNGEDAAKMSEAAAAAAGTSADVALITAAAGSIPAAAAQSGIPTLGQLELRLRSMKHTVSALAMMPAATDSSSSGGIITHAVARFFAWLKVDETSAVKALGADQAMESGGVDAAMAAAELYLSQGHVHDAVLVLQQAAKGSAAAAAVDAWCADALARASADQALKLLRAHATVMAATVV